jgi:hypothetical protein
MRYKFCYKLIRAFCHIVSDRLNKTTHRFLVIRRNAPVPLHKYLFILGQLPNGIRSPHTCDDIKDVETHSVQGFQVGGIGAPLIALIATLGIPGYPADLRHFFLFKTQTTSFFTQAFARAQIWELT